ncbi:MAG TPA: hypothetical protein VHB21_04545 [Minicystis sp.]|nr:hypothetical protein [Minicystis sp.]
MKGSEADKQDVDAGDFIVGVGGATLEGLDVNAAQPLFYGPADDATRHVELGCPAGAAFSCKTKPRTVTLPFEEDPIHL